MAWICGREGIEADDEVLAVLAQAGDGSVRDSLSALDQAIACCGTKLDAVEVRALLGAFSLDSLHQVTEALATSGSGRMLEIVAELERNGHNLQHFCRELARYFRNLVVAKIAGVGTRLIAASAQESGRLAEIAAGFSEEDLTRYLQLSLDLYGELQRSLEPRLHLEIGLLRMVQAGKLLPIEEALAMVGGGTPTPPAPPVRRAEPAKTAPARTASAGQAAPPTPAVSTPAAAPSDDSGWKGKLHAALMELGMAQTAHALDHSQVSESAGRLRIVAPKFYRLSMKEADLRKAIEQAGLGSPLLAIEFSDEAPGADAAPTPQARQDDELTARALAHPEVQRFRETFGGQVRAVRNLKE